MKKRMMAMGLVAVMAVTMLCGCANSKKNYQKELETFGELLELNYEKLSLADISEELTELLAEFKAKTDEGVELLEAFTELAENVADAAGKMESDTVDVSKMEKYAKNVADLGEDMEDLVEDFLDAAEDAGVDEDDIEDLEDIDVQKLMEITAQAVACKRPGDYERDADALVEVLRGLDNIYSSDYEEILNEYDRLISGLTVSTPYGKSIKSLLGEVSGVFGSLVEIEQDYGYGSDDYWDMYYDIEDEYEDLMEELEDEIENFADEAYDLGVESDSLDYLWDYYW